MKKAAFTHAAKLLFLFFFAAGILLLPADCCLAADLAAEIQLADGEYSIDVTLEGGSGRASISSPAVLIVRDGRAYARITWSSSNYDYMKVDGETYLPVNEEGNSAFEIPVTVFDQPMTVVGDTVAMSVPHEVEYMLTFSEASISSGAGSNTLWIVSGVLLFAAAVLLFVILRLKKRKK